MPGGGGGGGGLRRDRAREGEAVDADRGLPPGSPRRESMKPRETIACLDHRHGVHLTNTQRCLRLISELGRLGL